MQEPLSARLPVRALFLDIDGTLIGGSNTISPRVRHAIHAARERGCEIVLCTGRSRHTTQFIAEQIPPLGYAVTSNGGVAMHLGTGHVLHRRLLPIPVALQIVRAIVAVGAEPYVYEDAAQDGETGSRVLYHPELPIGDWAVAPRYRPHAEIEESLPFAPVSVSTFGPPQKIRPLVARLHALLPDEVSIIQSGSEGNWGIEIFATEVSKRLGLETVSARLEVDREETMAIGDHFNDLEMIRWAGIGVAMGNALVEVKSTADWVTGTVEEDGVAQAIERFVL